MGRSGGRREDLSDERGVLCSPSETTAHPCIFETDRKNEINKSEDSVKNFVKITVLAQNNVTLGMLWLYMQNYLLYDI